MSRVPLLTREGEVAIAKRIYERGELRITKAMSRSLLVARYVADIATEVVAGSRTLRDTVTLPDTELTERHLASRTKRFAADAGAVGGGSCGSSASASAGPPRSARAAGTCRLALDGGSVVRESRCRAPFDGCRSPSRCGASSSRRSEHAAGSLKEAERCVERLQKRQAQAVIAGHRGGAEPGSRGGAVRARRVARGCRRVGRQPEGGAEGVSPAGSSRATRRARSLPRPTSGWWCRWRRST